MRSLLSRFLKTHHQSRVQQHFANAGELFKHQQQRDKHWCVFFATLSHTVEKSKCLANLDDLGQMLQDMSNRTRNLTSLLHLQKMLTIHTSVY